MKYQFLYWTDPQAEDDKSSIITANSIKAACGKFIRNRIGNHAGLSVDHEVMVMESREYIDISEIESIKEFVR